MTKRQAKTSNGSDPAAPEHPPRDEEQTHAPARDSTAAAEKLTPREVDEGSTKEDHGADEALMESYNG